MTGDTTQQQMIAAVVVLAWRQRDAIKQVAAERGYIVVNEDGDEFAALPGSNEKYPLNDVSVVSDARQHFELIGHLVDIKIIAETWLSIGDGQIEADETIIAWLDANAAETYGRPDA